MATLTSVSLREPEVLRRLREHTAAMPNANMQIAPEQGQFMALLVKLVGARYALEVRQDWFADHDISTGAGFELLPE